MHLGPGLHVVRVVDGPLEVLPENGEGVSGPDVGDWVVSLVSRALDRVGRARGSLVVGQRSVRFQRMAQDVETCKKKKPQR